MPVRSILIVDNDFGDFSQIKSRIRSLDKTLTVGGVFSKESAHRVLKQVESDPDDMQNYLAIITEVVLDGGNSFDFIVRVRNSAVFKSIPILIYTGTDDEEAKRSCLAAGATKIFPKGPGTQGTEALAAYVVKLAAKSG